MAHITGGGLTDNLPRVLPDGTAARIDRSSWDVPALFSWLVRKGDVPDADAWRTFNMGIGHLLVTAPGDATAVLKLLQTSGTPDAHVVGAIIAGDRRVIYH